MYRSTLDPVGKLEFSFDPLRALHAREDSELRWPEFPYKQVLIDRVRTKASSKGDCTITVEAAAGALLMALGQETGALFEIAQHRPREGDEVDGDGGSRHSASGLGFLERRFTDEREAFYAAKRAHLLEQKQQVQSKLDSIEVRKREEQEREARDAWRQRQIVKRFADGSKYDGDGMRVNDVLVPHGYGTLWVPQKKQFMAEAIGDIKRVPRYIGSWMDGFMHGEGTYYWDNGDSWTGHFIRDEMEGKGAYMLNHFGRGGAGDETGRDDAEALTQPVRYYSASQHVCWAHELVRGCRIIVLSHRHYGHPLETVIKRGNADQEAETEFVLVSYDAARDAHLVRKCGTEDSKWLALHSVNFRVLPGKPVGRLESDAFQ
ncbi:hypothetical protein PybrP1_001776 [[Pythium] brassicae (nom. inval.)]|nr:hypothetical protein PybrP1_001776 [[Pythium] brassicae (nom. inval.)]